MARDRTVPNEHRRSIMDRRSYLKLAGAAVASVLTAGFVGTARAEKRYDTVVDVVDAGADPTGERPIDPVLERTAGDDTLLVFPDGEYRLGEFHGDGLSNFGMVGRDAATLIPSAGTRGDWLRLRGGRDHTIRDLTFDVSDPSTDARLTVRPDDGLDIRRSAVVGRRARKPRTAPLVVGLRDDDARGTVEDLRVERPVARGRPPVRMVVAAPRPSTRGLYRLSVDGTLDGGAETAAGVVSSDSAVATFTGGVDRLALAGPTTVRCDPTP